jgi:hypothetical protein
MCLAVGATAAQAGHLLAYQLRFGGAAKQLQSGGAHAYFPAVAKTGLGLAAAFVVVALVLVGLARLAAGRRLEGPTPPSYLRLVAMLFWIQLACFGLQETVEGASGWSPVLLLLWGTAGQLPIALVGALALRWFAVRLGPAVARLRPRPAAALRLVSYSLAPPVWPLAAEVVAPSGHLTPSFNRRGPPSAR